MTETPSCDCCTVDSDQTQTSETDRWLDSQSPLETSLPDDVQRSLGQMLGIDSVGSLFEWVTQLRQRLDGHSVGIEDLCHADERTDHWARLDGQRYDFLCFYDAVTLAAITDEPVDIHTVSPDGTVITAQAAGADDLTVSPDDAVFSFGVASDVEPPGDEQPTHAHVYSAVCPYVRAFPDRESYEAWADRVPAATVGLPLAGGTEMARVLVE